MKNILLAVLTTVLVGSCSPESEPFGTHSEGTTANLSTISLQKDTYKGVFTTEDSKYRATVNITIPGGEHGAAELASRYAITTLRLHTGELVEVKSTEPIQPGVPVTQLSFENQQLSFTLSIDSNGDNPMVSNLQFKGIDAYMLMAKHTAMNPVTPISGTYSCTTCNGHPNINTGLSQTFNMLFTVNSGTGSITTQTMLGTTMFTGIGYQDNCVAGSELILCDINSGDGSTTTIGYYSNGNPVYWSGTHKTSLGGISSGLECSQVNGTWQWQSISYGVLTGEFHSDSGC